MNWDCDPMAEALRDMSEITQRLSKLGEEDIKKRLKGRSIEELRWIGIKFIELNPILEYEKIDDKNGKITIKYRNFGYNIELREEPRTIEEATEIYNMINT